MTMIEGHPINIKEAHLQQAVTAVPSGATSKIDANAGTTTASAPTTTEASCCPVFDTARYSENVQVTWNDKLFLQESV